MSMYRRMRSLSYSIVLVVLWGTQGHADHGELPNRIPEATPYNVTEGEVYPPYEDKWTTACAQSGIICEVSHTYVASRDGRQPTVEPAVVEGAPPVPMQVANRVIPLTRTADTTPPTATPYPRAGADNVYEDVVVKVFFSEPVTGVDATTWTLTDAQGTAVPASVAQIGDYTWGLFPHQVFLTRGETYTARVAASVCDFAKNCLAQDLTWHFTITSTPGGGQGDTSIPLGGSRPATGERPATRGTPASLGPPMDGQTQPPKPDAALPPSTQTARP